MFSHCHLAIYNTFRVSALICNIEFNQELQMTVDKRHTPKSIGFSYTVIISFLCHEENHTLVHDHVHRVYTAFLGIQFACMPKCMQSKLGMCIPDIHVCDRFDIINLVQYAHAYLYSMHMLTCTHVKCVLSSPYCMSVLSSLN